MMHPLLRKIIQSHRDVGFVGMLRMASARLRSKAIADDFDQTLGVETAAPVSLWKLQINSANVEHGKRYQTAPARELYDEIGALPCDRVPTTFIDLGCGKGRPLLIAYAMGFRKLIGVEFSEALAMQARANLGSKAEIILGDAAEYRFPEGPIALFMYNPFDQPVMQSVLKNLRDHRGDLWVLYKFPRHAELLDQCGFLRRLPLDVPIWQKR